VDTSEQSAVEIGKETRRRRRSIEEKRRIVEETLAEGRSVARVARQHQVNANQVFYWRKLYRQGWLGIGKATSLLPVKVAGERPAETVQSADATLSSGMMEIKLSRGTLRITGCVDAVTLRAVLESLAG
jgi:transposase